MCHWAVFNRVLPRVLGDKNVLCFSLTASVCFCVCLHTSESCCLFGTGLGLTGFWLLFWLIR